MLLFVLDITDNPLERFAVLREELRAYSERLYHRPFLIALNKIDLVEHVDEEVVKYLEKQGPVFLISALVSRGLHELTRALYQTYQREEQREKENETGAL